MGGLPLQTGSNDDQGQNVYDEIEAENLSGTDSGERKKEKLKNDFARIIVGKSRKVCPHFPLTISVKIGAKDEALESGRFRSGGVTISKL